MNIDKPFRIIWHLEFLNIPADLKVLFKRINISHVRTYTNK